MKGPSIGLRSGFALRLLSGSALALVSMPAFAQTSAPEGSSDEAIVVTGSRAARAGFVAPSPTTVVGAAAIDQRQVTNIAQILNEQPSFRATTSPAANGIRTQTPGSSTADLRGLGAARTLVLVNGSRVPPLAPANNTGAVVAPDLNAIPTLMVEQIEVVTGGASAQWGSDAVAGVVNIRLKNHFEGLELRGQAGISGVGDAGQYRIGVLAGHSFGEGGHIVFGADYVKQNQMGDIYTRSWGYNEWGRVANSAFATNGQAANLIVGNVHAASTAGGLITGPASFALRNYQFLTGSTVAPFDTGGIRNSSVQIGGAGQSLAKGVSLAPGVERFNPYLRAEYSFSPAFILYGEASYSLSIGNSTTLPPRDNALTIQRDNAYLPASVAAAMGTLTSFTMSRIDYDLGNVLIKVTNRTPRFSLGGNGDLGGGWKWDAHVGWGENSYRNEGLNNRNVQAFGFAVDAVNYNGQTVCRATIPGASYNAAAAGCAPINLFGSGSPSAAALGYVTGHSQLNATYHQLTSAANIHGEPFSTWAGPVSLAAGAEYRRESEVVTADPIAQAGGWESSNGTAFGGSFHVAEGYVEAIAPLARDLTFVRRLDLNGALRVANYSSSGTQTTWKAGATWEVVDGLRLRFTRSHDIRAPAIYELFSAGSVTYLSATVGTVTVGTLPQNSTVGNPRLKPEVGDTLTAGIVLQPRAVPGLAISADYYNIKLKQAITSVTGATAGTLCTAGQTYYCGLFTYNGATPTSFSSPYINAAALNPEGIDLVASYRRKLGGSHGASLTLSSSGTYTLHFKSDLGNGSAPIEYAGENSTAGAPRFRSNTSLTYDDDRFSLTAQFVTISAGKIDATADLNAATSLNVNHVAAVQYVHLQSSIKVGKAYEFFMGINNLMNTAPPALPSSTLFTLTNGVFYDVVGRAFTAGFKARF